MKKRTLKILFCGDSEVGGAANYLLGVFKSIPAKVTHIPPAKKLTLAHLKTIYDVIVLSDYSYDQLTKAVEKKILKQAETGAGLLMVGGWGSFSGIFGKWRGSQIEKALPVKCSAKDDRLNFSGGAQVMLSRKHSILEGLPFNNPPIICGLNDVKVRANSQVLVEVHKILKVRENLALDPNAYPLLVVSEEQGRRSVAYSSDFAPHWCGGLVDWGPKRVKLPVTKGVEVEVGNYYVLFITQIIRWLAGDLT